MLRRYQGTWENGRKTIKYPEGIEEMVEKCLKRGTLCERNDMK